jgi:hypothetical protein
MLGHFWKNWNETNSIPGGILTWWRTSIMMNHAPIGGPKILYLARKER